MKNLTSKNSKKYLIIAIFLAIFIGFANSASAQTLEELQAKILVLWKQIEELQKQLAATVCPPCLEIPSTTSSIAVSTTTVSTTTSPVSVPEFCYTFRKNVTKKNITSDEIKQLQEILEREGFEISNEEKTNAILGDTTQSAISLFQEKYAEEILSPWNLEEASGILGPLTIKKMNELYGCEKKIPPKKINQILLKFKKGTPQAKIDQVLAKHKLIISPEDKRDVRERERFFILRIPEEKSSEEIVEEIKKEADIEYSEPDSLAKPLSSVNVNDTYALMQLAFYRIGVLSNEGTGAFNLISNFNQNIKVAVLDTGIDDSHPDLQGRVIVHKNFSSSGTTLPVCQHGNQTAGIVAATTNNSLGVAGTGNNVSLMNVKVFGDDCWAWFSDIASGIYWATNNGADVINVSVGCPVDKLDCYSTSVVLAINYAWENGVVIVAPAGNDNRAKSTFPASVSSAISVAATNLNDEKASFSNYGSGVDIAAPTQYVYTTTKNGYNFFSGTSASAPQVAGLAALILATGQCPLKDNNCVRNKIESTADRILNTGNYWQYGRINAFKALGGANYQEPVFKSLIIKKSGTGNGTVRTITPPKAAINCGSKCSAKFALNSDITIKAITNTGSKFIKWSSGPCKGSTSTTCSLTFNPDPDKSSQTITAVFELVKPLVIQKSGTGNGTVKSTEPTNAINCGIKCSANFAVNTKITLKATPNATSTFVKWTSDGPCDGLASSTCAFIFNPPGEKQYITAVFKGI